MERREVEKHVVSFCNIVFKWEDTSSNYCSITSAIASDTLFSYVAIHYKHIRENEWAYFRVSRTCMQSRLVFRFIYICTQSLCLLWIRRPDFNSALTQFDLAVLFFLSRLLLFVFVYVSFSSLNRRNKTLIHFQISHLEQAAYLICCASSSGSSRNSDKFDG